jgi:hypothetical protein
MDSPAKTEIRPAREGDSANIGPAKLVYIGGYGRSGSTLLEALMTTSPDFVACGETIGAFRVMKSKRRCSCGRLAIECPVWGPVLESLKSNPDWTHRDLDLALLEYVASTQRVLVDSSKTAWREALFPFKLRNTLKDNFQFVHLVRDPRAVCWSVTRDENKRAERLNQKPHIVRRCLIGASGWLFANLVSEIFRWRYPSQYVRVRYEDIVRSPQTVLESLFQRLSPGGVVDLDHPGERDNRHQLYANRARRTSLSLSDVREDEEWKTALPSNWRRVVTLLDGPLARRYGYL